MRKSLVLLLTILLSLILTGCSNEKKININQTKDLADQVVKVKIATIGDSAVMIDWISEIVDPNICKIEVIAFTENQAPAMALKEREIDGFIANQIIWLGVFNSGNKCNLHMIEPYIYYPQCAAYSIKHDSIDSIPQNGKVVISGDPSNMERALLILEGMELIKLGPKVGKFYNLLDIEKNYRNLKFTEMEQTTTASSVRDVDLVICTATSIMKSGYDAIKDSLYDDPEAKDYSIGLVVQPENKDAKWVAEIVRAMQTDKWKEQFNEYFKGTRVLY